MEPGQLRIDKSSMKRILRIGLPAGAQSAVFSVANIIIQGAINSLVTVVMAASGAAFNIEIITYDILNSFSQACTTFVGQNYGAGEIGRCKKTLALCLGEGITALAVAIAVILPLGKPLLSIFNNDSTFQTIMAVLPISLAAPALLMLIAALCYRPARRFTLAQGTSK